MLIPIRAHMASQMVLEVKDLPASAEDIRDADVILGSGRSPEEGNGNPFQYSYLENAQQNMPIIIICILTVTYNMKNIFLLVVFFLFSH